MIIFLEVQRSDKEHKRKLYIYLLVIKQSRVIPGRAEQNKEQTYRCNKQFFFHSSCSPFSLFFLKGTCFPIQTFFPKTTTYRGYKNIIFSNVRAFMLQLFLVESPLFERSRSPYCHLRSVNTSIDSDIVVFLLLIDILL